MDLHFLPLVRHDGQDQAELPGLHIAAPPRRPARGRQPDRLVIYLSMEGNAPLPQDQQEQLLKRLAESYYKTPGSVTAAMRTVIESLNQYLLDRNLRGASSGRQGLGLLTLLTLREDRLYLAQCGPVHAYLLAESEVRHINDPQPARRGLGLGRTAPIYYAQTSLSADDLLLVNHQPLAGDEVVLAGQRGQGLEGLRRRLLSLVENELACLLVQAKVGPGKTFLLKPKPLLVATGAVSGPAAEAVHPAIAQPTREPTPDEIAAPAVQTAPAAPIEQAAEEAPAIPEIQETAPSEPIQAPVRETAQPAEPMIPSPAVSQSEEAFGTPAPTPQSGGAFRSPVAASQPRESFGSAVTVSQPGEAFGSPPAEAEPQPIRRGAPPRRRRARSGPVVPALATIGRAFGSVFGQFTDALGTLFKRMLPGEGTLPGPMMAVIAIVVPFVVVAIATVIYLQRGRGGEYQARYAEAVQIAGSAREQSDPLVQEQAWTTVLEKLDKAESYGVTSESQALRQQAQGAIDALNLAVRLDFQPAIIEGLPSGSRVTRLVATDTDLYLLDASTGSVYRGISAGRGYDIDKTYLCGPGVQGSQGIGPLVDIQLFTKPDGSGNALLGVDSIGSALLCTPGAPPEFIPMTPPPAGWSGVKALAINQGDAYVLDPGTKQIWVYNNGNFTAQPDLFFDRDIPPLEDVIDLAVDQEDLYLLHQDGHLTLCSFSSFGVAATQCTDPAPFLDARPGRESQPMTPPVPFTEILSTQPPDPSIYLLDPNTPAAYHFSLRLAYQRQIQPVRSIVTSGSISVTPASAFALTPDSRLIFLAFGNEVVYAGMP